MAFLLLVPTLLHIAVPAFGQGNGQGVGYETTVTPGGSGTTTSTGGSLPGVPTRSLSLTRTPDAPLQLADVTTAQQLAAGVVGGTVPLQDVSSDPAALRTLVGTPVAFQQVLDDAAARDALLSDSAALAAVLENPAASAAFARQPDVQARLASDAQFREDLLARALALPSVSGVNATLRNETTDGRIVVNEFLTTDSRQSAVQVADGTPIASVTLQVGTGGGTATYRPLKVLEVHVEGVPPGGVEMAELAFTVTDAELALMGIAPEDVELLHLVGGQWVPLPTEHLGEVGGVHSYRATTPGFSYFAIAGAAPPADAAAGSGALGMVGLLLALLALVVIVAVVVVRRKREN